MRLGGPTPFGQQSVEVPLPSGGQFYVPAGNYLVRLGSQTVLQFFDPVQMTWRCVGSPNSGAYFPISCDGFNYRLVNASGVVTGAKITNAGSGATNGIGAAATGVSVSFGAAPSNGQAATAYAIVGGAINTTIAITAGGSGFTVPPLLLIDPPPPGGIQATATCTISAGAINAVTVQNAGAGYTSVPNVYVIPQYATYPGVTAPVNATQPSQVPPGAFANNLPGFLPNVKWNTTSGGALLTVNPTLAGSGTVTGIVMTGYGAGYAGTTIPTITITGAGAAAATALMSMCLLSATITNAGAAYSVAPAVFSTYGLLLAQSNNEFYRPRPAIASTTVSSGNVATVVVEDPGFGFQSVPILGVAQAGGTPATTEATLTAVVGGQADISTLQPAVQ